MIWIQKGREPSSLEEYRQQPYASYDGYPDKEELRAALLRDQGYICAYCMRRIENDRNTMKIEHWKAQSSMTKEVQKLNFNIMLGVCDGCRGETEYRYTTCDTHRGDAELYVNPLDKRMMDTIKYDRNGHIHSQDARIEHDLTDTLNLNCEQAPSQIVANRRLAYDEFEKELHKLQNKGKWNVGRLKKLLHDYEQLNDGKRDAYIGVALYLIHKCLHRAGAE